jgi:hypothetical protein
VRKLLSIGIVLALLVTFVVPGVVGAQDECDNPCDYEPAECGPLPDKTTKTLAGAAVWTMLGASDIMGRAVCATTGQMVCNLGGWSDELGVVAVEVSSVALDGLAGLVEYAMDAFLDMAELGEALGDLLRGIAGALGGIAEEE